MSRVIVKKSRIHGNGVFAQRVYVTGDVIKDGHISFQRKFRGYNHSCRPNVVLARHGDELLPVVVRRVRPGQELTVSYGFTTRRPLRRPFKCGCSTCRRK